ncbi:LuxR C-terminal-related transcriptional regulator [Amycolatopsis sp. NPDC088138]|uniref:helix-turn-helix transcriptional regulator n=1 Tax=Amycolatopsis sp. NPDC088138 TaxID=3363938 RepID=UPI00380A3F2B
MGVAETSKSGPEQLGAVRHRRRRLLGQGRWREADETVRTATEAALDQSTGATGPELGDLVYAAGGPRADTPVCAGLERQKLPVQRRHAMAAIQLANRGVDREEAVRLANTLLASPGREETGSLWYSLLALAYAGETGRAVAEARQALRSCRPDAVARHRDALTVLRARLTWLSGAPAEAATTLAEVSERGVYPQLTGVTVAWRVAAMIDLGDLEGARSVLFGNGFGGPLADAADGPELLMARGELHIATGKYTFARDDFRECGRLLAEFGVVNPAVLPWRSRQAICEHELGRPEIASALANQEFAAARRWGSARAVGVAAHAVAVTGGRDPGALLAATTHLRHAEATGELLRVRYDLALALEAAGKPAAARTALAEVGRAARSAGYTRLAAQAGCIGGTWATGTLTPQERKIAALARAGRSNRQIAQTESVTLRTVEFHLTSAYRKLGIRGRRELGVLQGLVL